MTRLIDIIFQAAKLLNAEHQAVRLYNIRKKAISLDKEHKYKESSYDAELNFHTINMRSRFFSLKEKEPTVPTRWKNEPYFYRTSPGFYKLLSEEDKNIFELALKNNLDIVYKDEYDINSLYLKVKSANLVNNKNENNIKSTETINPKKNINSAKYLEHKVGTNIFTNLSQLSILEPQSKDFYKDDKKTLVAYISKYLIYVYNNYKIPKYLKYYYHCGFTKENFKNDPNHLFRLLIFTSYDQGPYTGAAKGWEPIWGISGVQTLPYILSILNLFTLQEVDNLTLQEIDEKLKSKTFYNYHIDKKNSYCPPYAKTFKTIYKKITEDFLLNKFFETDTREKVMELFNILIQIENIGETIASKIIMYLLREININNIDNKCFCDVASKIMGEFHNNKLINKIDNYYFKGFSKSVYEELINQGDPYAIDALYYVDRDERSLKKGLFLAQKFN